MVSRAGFSADLSGPGDDARAVPLRQRLLAARRRPSHGYSGKTNTQSNTAFRGFGGPQGAIAIEVHPRLDRAQARHATRSTCGAPTSTASASATSRPTASASTDNVIHELTDELDDEQRLPRAPRTRSPRSTPTSPVLKRGLALTPVKFGISFNVTHFNQAGALVHVYVDGSMLVNHGGTEMGQGLNTKVAQVVAHELGVELRPRARHGHRHAEGRQHLGHRGVDRRRPERQGRAGRRAPDPRAPGRLRRARATAARPTTCASPTTRVHVNGHAMPVPRAGARGLRGSRAAVVGRLLRDARPALGSTTSCRAGRSSTSPTARRVSEVVVDTLTGEWKLLRADVLHDAGRSLNPAIDIGQVEGAFIQGMGWLTTEELVWHPKTGLLMTHAPSTYKIPTANDCPPVFNVRAVRQRERRGQHPPQQGRRRAAAAAAVLGVPRDPRCGVGGGRPSRRSAAARAGDQRGDPRRGRRRAARHAREARMDRDTATPPRALAREQRTPAVVVEVVETARLGAARARARACWCRPRRRSARSAAATSS